ncbi:MAG: nuclear transport factor 2 family protein [Rhodospirillaceae bacterium]|nr:nuclear transport factor 2 family protein [Rhodospirillaceae bacterium]
MAEMPDAEALVRDFLAAVERRDAGACQAVMAPAIVMTFPSGVRHADIQALFASSGKRYRAVAKTIEQVDVLEGGDSTAIVYCFGTLYGTWMTGEAFSGIRFIDRFEIRGGLITRQDVWNDSAIFRPAAPPPA